MPSALREYHKPSDGRPDSRRFVWSILRGGLLFVVGLAALSLVAVAIFGIVPVPTTPLVAIRAVEAGLAGRPIRISKSWVPLESISPNVMRAAIASEDYRFLDHDGFDFEAIRKAMRANERAKLRGDQRIRGASTISQQTAKNVFLWPGRTWVRKGLEAWLTVLIEATWSKRRILEVYLNVIEFGDGVYGVEAASQKFFKKRAKSINASEAALLISVLPNPRKLRVDRPSAYVRYRQTAIMRRLSYVDVPN